MLRYDIRTGVKQIKTKTAIVISAVTLGVSGIGMAVMVPAISHAAGGPSACGSAHGAFANENGNFGFLGQDFQGAPNYHGGIRGQTPGATGYNNSHTNCQG